LEAARASALARAERRFRGLTTTERELLESTTGELVEELLKMLDRPAAHRTSVGDAGDG
jgi:hypothetical protein